MNERIKELAKRAGYLDKGNNHTAYMNFDHEKFAELIVKECIGQAEDYGLGSDAVEQLKKILELNDVV